MKKLVFLTIFLVGALVSVNAQTDSIIVDYMLCFDESAQEWVSSHRTSLEAYADEVVESINYVYKNSNVKARFRVAGIIRLNQSFDSPNTAINTVMMDSAVCRQRWENHADLTVVLCEPPAYVSLGGTAIQECDASTAFSAIRCSEAATGYIACHESGHNIGCQHGRLQDDPGTHKYAVGCERSPYYTVMVTGAATANILAPVFSGPETVWKGVVMGSETENNVRMLRERLPIVSKFGDQVDYEVDWNEWNPTYEKASKKLKITCSAPFDIRCSEKWLKASTDRGYGNTEITVSVDENKTGKERQATLLVYDSWYMYAPQKITITQLPDGTAIESVSESRLNTSGKLYLTPYIYIKNHKKYLLKTK